LRGLRVTIDPARGIVVSVPPAQRRGWAHPEPMIERFLRERESWVRRHLERQARQQAEIDARGGLRDGAAIRYRGQLHRLTIAGPGGGRRSIVRLVPGYSTSELTVELAPPDRRPLSAVLETWLRDRAREQIEVQIARHADAFGVVPAAVAIRDQRSRWGSASRQRRLSFSWRLILAPPEALETVVVHELAHLRVFGHGAAFWALVAARRPDHLVWRRWLRHHSHELHAALTERGTGAERDEAAERASA
jgi:predicted metal-dependent hydrolase